LNEDVPSHKVMMLGRAMAFTPDQAARFWPIYAAYTSESKELGDIRERAVREYAANFANMDERTADDLAQRTLRFAARRTALLQRYYESVKEQLGPRIAARFLQVETRLIALQDLQVWSQVPLLK
jgi:hypothetical protein